MAARIPVTKSPTVIYYHIKNTPSHQGFISTSAGAEIKDALRAWNDVSVFSFIELSDKDSKYTPPSFMPRIEFDFGEVPALDAAICRFAGDVAQNVQTITFRDTLTWVSAREKRQEFDKMVGGARPRFTMYAEPLATLMQHDLFTVAMHEIGHALGLDHDTNQDSIMLPRENQLENVIMTRSVPSIDAVTLASLYSIVVTPTTLVPVTASGKGYLIVGGEFVMSTLTSKAPHNSDSRHAWGKTSRFKALMSCGYCYNPFLSGRGYGDQYIYLLPVEEVDENDLVVVGGRYYGKNGNREQLYREIKSTAQPSGWGVFGEWPGVILENLNHKEQLIAHYDSLLPNQNVDGYSIYQFLLRYRHDTNIDGTSSMNGVQLWGGCMQTGDRFYQHAYQGRTWGVMPSPPDFIMVGTCRTWADETQRPPKINYDYANAQIRLWPAPRSH